jgi:hypothetical protein
MENKAVEIKTGQVDDAPYEFRGVFVKFDVKGNIEVVTHNINDMARKLGYKCASNIRRGLSISDSLYHYFDTLAKMTGIKVCTLSTWAKEETHGLRKVRKTPVIRNETLMGGYNLHNDLILNWVPSLSDAVPMKDLPHHLEPFQQTESLAARDGERNDYVLQESILIEEDSFTRGREGRKCILLTEDTGGKHPCKIAFEDGMISYCRPEQIVRALSN